MKIIIIMSGYFPGKEYGGGSPLVQIIFAR